MSEPRKPVILMPGEGRLYDMGRLQSNFKADGAESCNLYSISEWWLEPRTTGPGPHSHEEDDLFYMLEGVMSFYLGDHWIEAGKGSFLLVPGGMKHDFENRSDHRAGFLNISTPGGFEEHMPGIADWFRTNPTGNRIV